MKNSRSLMVLFLIVFFSLLSPSFLLAIPPKISETVYSPSPCPKAFQGIYLGGNIGYGFGILAGHDALNSTSQPYTAKAYLSAQGIDGGLLVGYTHIFSNKVGLGLEAYFNWTNAETVHVGNLPDGRPYSHPIVLKNDFQLRIPISYVICNLIAPKIVFGWDNARWTSTLILNEGQTTVPATARYNGFLWGAGIDFLIAEHVISGLEYTGVLSEKRSFYNGPSRTDILQLKPIYNTFKFVLKFIY